MSVDLETRRMMKKMLADMIRPLADITARGDEEAKQNIARCARFNLEDCIDSFTLKMQTYMDFLKFAGKEPITSEAAAQLSMQEMRAFITAITIYEQCVIQALDRRNKKGE